MPYIVNEEVLDDTLDNMAEDERANIIYTFASKMRRIIQHISEADVRNNENPLVHIAAKIQSGNLPEYLPDGTDVLHQFEKFYENVNEFIDKGRTEWAKTSVAFMDMVDEVCKFANFLLPMEIRQRAQLAVYMDVKGHLEPLTNKYLTFRN